MQGYFQECLDYLCLHLPNVCICNWLIFDLCQLVSFFLLLFGFVWLYQDQSGFCFLNCCLSFSIVWLFACTNLILRITFNHYGCVTLPLHIGDISLMSLILHAVWRQNVVAWCLIRVNVSWVVRAFLSICIYFNSTLLVTIISLVPGSKFILAI